jgi:chloride channel protein, CIC family
MILPEPPPASEFDRETRGIERDCLVALLGGILIGVIGAGFRAGLDWLAVQHTHFVQWAHAWPWMGWLLPVALGALGAAIARAMVRPQPLAAGSGVQHIEAVTRGEAEPASMWVVPIKFVGGLVGIGTGLALGREGPTIQMGATIGAALARKFRCAAQSLREVQAALGGAGLAVAFNAPIGGAMFVFEEVSRAFRLRLTLLTLIGTASAIAVVRLILGDARDFSVAPLVEATPWRLGIYFLFGGALGLLGVLYNRTTLFFMDALARLRRWPAEARAALVGALVGLVAWFSPAFVGSGDPLTQQILNGGMPAAMLLLVVAIRWLVGPLSYSAGTPGGLFSPLLLVGAALGAVMAAGYNAVAPPAHAVSGAAFAVVGMAAFFTGVVRAPFTGIVLIAEMTGVTNLMDSMLASVFGAMLVSSLVRGEPIYDTLRRRMLGVLSPR